ncbi:RAMP superfamily CRISPR-associated protein [Mangrovimonas sp. TPBH4]|uniref:RAMP superfamily CRISPR-associated protein n=1 Tax=Mangrovimonas sp. TPBH4 TaxID=1645914 RepID=UPI0006B49193|nr:RAMP superfamily CRISPR-associated protein [Mangrovimonas sp. TPBH4]
METDKINYSITFLSDWHAGSGLGSGAAADSVVIKDKNNLPYLPGKTIKGLLKDVLLEIKEVQPDLVSGEELEALFGKESNNLSEETVNIFFSNATLPKVELEAISDEMSPFLYRNISSTKINSNGVAEDSSLRTIEVCVPVTLEGSIAGNFTSKHLEILKSGLKMLRAIGVQRNRGLGRCKIQIKS